MKTALGNATFSFFFSPTEEDGIRKCTRWRNAAYSNSVECVSDRTGVEGQKGRENVDFVLFVGRERKRMSSKCQLSWKRWIRTEGPMRLRQVHGRFAKAPTTAVRLAAFQSGVRAVDNKRKETEMGNNGQEIKSSHFSLSSARPPLPRSRWRLPVHPSMSQRQAILPFLSCHSPANCPLSAEDR